MVITIKVGSRACMKIELISQKRNKKKYRVCDGVIGCREGTEMIPLPKNMEIVDKDGNPIETEGEIYVTAETIDPYRLVTCMF